MGGNGVGQRGVPRRALGVVSRADDQRGDPRLLRPGQRPRLRPVGADGDDLGTVDGVGAGVEQGLQGAAGAGGEDDQARGQESSRADRAGRTRGYSPPGRPSVTGLIPGSACEVTSPQDPFATPPSDGRPSGDPSASPQSSSPQYGQSQPYGSQPYGTQPYGTQPYGSQPYGTGPTRSPRNGFGIAALVLGILALLLGVVLVGALFGLAAIVFGFLGRARARRGEATNGGMALAGIILGVVGILVSIFIVVSVSSLFGEQFSSLTECLDQAGTQAEVEQCQRDFADQLGS